MTNHTTKSGKTKKWENQKVGKPKSRKTKKWENSKIRHFAHPVRFFFTNVTSWCDSPEHSGSN